MTTAWDSGSNNDGGEGSYDPQVTPEVTSPEPAQDTQQQESQPTSAPPANSKLLKQHLDFK